MNARVRIKVCGLTRPEDALAAEAAGADALGVIFAAGSKRRVDVVQARRVLAPVGPFVARVGVFVDAPVREVLEAVRGARLSAVQVHGAESAATVAEIAVHVPVVRAVRWRPGFDPVAHAEEPIAALLVDGPEPGSGHAFDWDAAAAVLARGPRWVLAGGLTPDNVAAAVARLRPHGVDVASGVESAPGIKDPARLRAFVAAVRAA
ncbi:MAG: phosphoribosylanthranilate isomerase [Trueperaceae bacterium]